MVGAGDEHIRVFYQKASYDPEIPNIALLYFEKA